MENVKGRVCVASHLILLRLKSDWNNSGRLYALLKNGDIFLFKKEKQINLKENSLYGWN